MSSPTGPQPDGASTPNQTSVVPFVARWRNAIRDSRTLTMADKSVLYTLSTYMDANGANAWPSIDMIAKGAGVGRRTTLATIKKAKGVFLVVQRRPNKTSLYGALIPEGSSAAATPEVSPAAPLEVLVQHHESVMEGVKPSMTGTSTSKDRGSREGSLEPAETTVEPTVLIHPLRVESEPEASGEYGRSERRAEAHCAEDLLRDTSDELDPRASLACDEWLDRKLEEEQRVKSGEISKFEFVRRLVEIDDGELAPFLDQPESALDWIYPSRDFLDARGRLFKALEEARRPRPVHPAAPAAVSTIAEEIPW